MVQRLLAATRTAVKNVMDEDVTFRTEVVLAIRAAVPTKRANAVGKRGVWLRSLLLERNRARVARRARIWGVVEGHAAER